MALRDNFVTELPATLTRLSGVHMDKKASLYSERITLMRKLALMIITLCSALLCTTPVFAGEGGLYPAALPPGSAFIRFLNGNSPMAVPVIVRGKAYGAATFGNITAYAPVQQGDATLTLGTKTTTVHLKEGSYYTALLHKGDVDVLEEPVGDNKLKAQIILINASSTSDIALKTADGSTDIVKAVDTAKLDGRAVNPIKAPFSVYAAAKKIDVIDARLLERGARYAVVVYDGPNGKPVATFN